MKKLFIIFLIIVLLILIFVNKTFLPNLNNKSINSTTKQNKIDKTTVSYNGWLHTNGYILENEKNQSIQLRGVSSHGIEWFSDIITYENLENLKNNWNINIFRIAMYTDSNGQGYIYNKEITKQKVYNIIDIAINLDMYIIIDWHILNDNNPQIHKEEAKIFFSDISKKYAGVPNVIYEICNEPNGNEITWEKDIKPYANEIIPIIRNNSPYSFIIVGTPNWCKELNYAADDPLEFSNIAYACHFYSGSHDDELMKKIDYCIAKNIPIFVSECGLTQANGNGNLYLEEFNTWINYLNSKNISWIYWSFSNKNESSAILLPEYNIANNKNVSSDNKLFDEYLTQSGKFIKKIFQSYKTD